MLRTELINLINSGRAWAFVGSGISIDAGFPSWQRLVTETVSQLEASVAERIQGDLLYQRHLKEESFDKCFSRIEHHAHRDNLENSIIGLLRKTRPHGKLASLISDWPFAGYVTTNYDSHLEELLMDKAGWVPVGNTADEVRKISGDPQQLVWHIHGSVNLENSKSRLILTEADYDSLYLNESQVVNRLKSLLTQVRIVFFGFGFRDAEVKRVLRIVGRLTTPDRPAIAFVSDLYGNEHEDERKEFLEKYNIDVVPYQNRNNSHSELADLLKIYDPLILKRSLRYGRPFQAAPSYDAETTGLLVYNTLALQGHANVGVDILGTLLRSRIISVLKQRGKASIVELIDDLSTRITLIQGINASTARSPYQIKAAIDDLLKEKLINQINQQDDPETFGLTEAGTELVADQSASSALMAHQFFASLRTRVIAKLDATNPSVDRIVGVCESFLKDTIYKRALGVAKVWASTRDDMQSYEMVALLQALPSFLEQVQNTSDALVLINVIEDVLTNPSGSETRYLGLLLQSQFGVNILGYDPESVNLRAEELKHTVFVIDSSTLIRYMATHSVGHDAARLMIEKLRTIGSRIATTTMLVDEVVEHARWPIEFKIITEDGYITHETLKAALGISGYKGNVFLAGFLTSIDQGGSPSYWRYLEKICGAKFNTRITVKVFSEKLAKEFALLEFGELAGDNETLYSKREELQLQIAGARRAHGTYRHERQTRAEAEVLIIVESVRTDRVTAPLEGVTGAYFVSHTRILDRLSDGGLPITMRPEAVLQWLNTVAPCSVDELGYLINGLLAELEKSGAQIVDKRVLQTVFSPLIQASKEQCREELEKHKALVAHRFGIGSERAFMDTPDLEFPIVMQSYYVQKTEILEAQLRSEAAEKAELQRAKALTVKERAELASFRAKKEAKRAKQKSKSRAKASRPKKKK